MDTHFKSFPSIEFTDDCDNDMISAVRADNLNYFYNKKAVVLNNFNVHIVQGMNYFHFSINFYKIIKIFFIKRQNLRPLGLQWLRKDNAFENNFRQN